MPDELLPPPIGTTPLSPPSLSPEQRDLCNRLDEWHAQSELKVKPSKMFQGTVFAVRPECQSNSDRIAQAAHSLREILYPLWSKDKEAALKTYGSVNIDKAFIEKAGRVYGQLSNLAHHRHPSNNQDFSSFTISDFQQLLAEFQRVMLDLLKRQTDIHRELDQIFSYDPTEIILDHPTT